MSQPRLESVPIPTAIDRRPLPPPVRLQIHAARCRIERFQDRWDRPQPEQFVAADYELVYQALEWWLETRRPSGNRFLEWGCGFAVVTAMAASLGLDALGIEAEGELLAHGRQTLSDWDQPAELIRGDFLPRGAETLADDPTLPSLGHDLPCGYETLDLELDDFSLVYGYPWPGEETFHQEVFRRHAAPGAELLQFCGPHDLRLWRKVLGGGGR